VNACADTTHLHRGPYSGYDIENVEVKAEAVDETGVFVVSRAYQVSPVGRDTQYMSTVLDVENRSGFAFCVKLGAGSEQSDALVDDDGVVLVAPHSVRDAVAVVSGTQKNPRGLSWYTRAQAWPADREGVCGDKL
jgi:hypothetical protein